MLTTTTPKGNPHAIPTGAPPTFAADLSDLSDYFAAGRSFRKVATQAALIALTGMADRDVATVDTVLGGFWTYNGATAKWILGGSPVFADAAARNAAITTPAVDMVTRLATERFSRRYGTAWLPVGGGLLPIRPASAVGATLGADGAATITAGTVSLNGCFTGDFDNYYVELNVATAAAASISFRLRVGGVDNSTSYIWSGSTATTSAVTAQGAVSVASFPLADAQANPMTMNGHLEFQAPFLAGSTTVLTDVLVINNSSAAPAKVARCCYHTQAVAYDGFTILLSAGSASGTIRVYGYNNN